jgi:hypothetical protein
LTNLSKALLLSTLLILPNLSYAITLPDRNTEDLHRDVDLSWSVPTQREDGTPLPISELGGYEIAVDCGNGNVMYDVPTGVDSRIIKDLPVGTCEFSISAFDTDGLQSAWSEVIATEIKSGYGPQKVQLFKQNIQVVINIST